MSRRVQPKARMVAEHFRSDGRAKQAFAEREMAIRAAAAYGAQFYLCEFCGRYHLGGQRSRHA